MAEITRRRQGELLAGVFRLLTDHPDGLDAKDLLLSLRALVRPTQFEESEYPNRPGVVRYDKIVRFASILFVKAGWLAKSKGRWAVTDEGRREYERYAGDPERFMRAAVTQYQQWRRDRPNPSPEPEEIESEAAEVAIGYEEAEEAAFAEIKAHIEKIPPYDFQELVAALLRAMAYHVTWIAPPGPDRGVDILAGPDPLGIQEPRIKVQVKHRPYAATDVNDLRSFLAVLGTRDVGIFVSTGGFTRDARIEARTHETRRLTLLDLGELLDLWIVNYSHVEEAKRTLLPLRPVYYLAPLPRS
jgi:restriction system protein